MTDDAQAERARHIEMLEHPERWPHIVIVPVKRWTGTSLDTAIVRSTARGLHLIANANLFDTSTWAGKSGTPLTAEEIVDLGWRVD